MSAPRLGAGRESDLIVDGPRPAVSWVASLPASWTTERERLVLLLLACDAFDDVSRPGGAALAAWAGILNGRLYETLGALERPNGERPALLTRVDVKGRTIPPGKRYGGRGVRTGYQLHTDRVLSRLFGRVTEPGNSPEQSGEIPEACPAETLPGNSPGKLSRQTLPAGRETPCPSLPSTKHLDQLPHEPRARTLPDWSTLTPDMP